MESVYEIARKAFDDQYYIEKLTDDERNKEQIKEFNGGEKGLGLENKLKNNGWSETDIGDSSYYLVKDRRSKEIATFFSIKCGLLYEPQHYEKLQSDDRDFVNLLVEAIETNNDEAIANYKASDLYTLDKFETLYMDAKKLIKAKENKRESGSINVKYTYSAIEVQNLCRNHNYSIPESVKAPIGFQTFWFVIVPIIENVASLIGCRYVYLFAADATDQYRLIDYYKNRWGFESLADLTLSVIRPEYDYNCQEMYTSVADLVNAQKNIWEQFADVYGLL